MTRFVSTLLFLTALISTAGMAQDNGHKLQGGQHTQADTYSPENPPQGEYLLETVECTVVEVGTQFESGTLRSEFHCLEKTPGKDEIAFVLANLPSDFEATYRTNYSSGTATLKVRKLYRSQYQLIFTSDTDWSLIDNSK